MRLSSLNKYLTFFILIFATSPLISEETVDIWKKKIKDQSATEIIQSEKIEKKDTQSSLKNSAIQEANIDITNNFENTNNSKPLYGIFDPEENNFSLNMWSQTDGKDIKLAFKRISKIKLSKTAEELFINTILTFAYSPIKNMSDEEFLDLKINWLIENKKDDLLEEFLELNKNFKNKKKIIQYLVDKNISNANISQGCKKLEFISKENNSTYLEKFKIYCLIFNDQKNEAQLLFDLLKEQNLSDSFFDDKIKFLLGLSDVTSNKIREDNLLNFYLSSVTVDKFEYEPNEQTNKYIWEYLNAANLVKVKDLTDKVKIKTLEIAANQNTLDKSKIFEIYKKLPFDLNSLINADSVYQSFDGIDSRALIYQKYLLSDNVENRIKYLFLLKDLFKKQKLSNIFTEFMSNELKKVMENDIPESYQEAVTKNITSERAIKLGRIKYDDKILHKSKVIRYYTEKNTPIEKSQKDLDNIYKKIKRNKKYFFSTKDLILIESLSVDGFKIPKEINLTEITKKYNIPGNLLAFAKNGETGFLALKIVEIIGEDKIKNLDPETVYFMTNLLNKLKLIKLRNELIVSSLPLRI